mmetsp:Transcript_25028/g.45279  ORF Transcript_25028/g.45279 Transcript_25028/m.45279 type:complete len:259 (-) Transcript_25028:217-993(-)
MSTIVVMGMENGGAWRKGAIHTCIPATTKYMTDSTAEARKNTGSVRTCGNWRQPSTKALRCSPGLVVSDRAGAVMSTLAASMSRNARIAGTITMTWKKKGQRQPRLVSEVTTPAATYPKIMPRFDPIWDKAIHHEMLVRGANSSTQMGINMMKTACPAPVSAREASDKYLFVEQAKMMIARSSHVKERVSISFVEYRSSMMPPKLQANVRPRYVSPAMSPASAYERCSCEIMVTLLSQAWSLPSQLPEPMSAAIAPES